MFVALESVAIQLKIFQLPDALSVTSIVVAIVLIKKPMEVNIFKSKKSIDFSNYLSNWYFKSIISSMEIIKLS